MTIPLGLACFSFPRAGPRAPGFPLSRCHQAPPCASPASTLHGRAALPPPAPAMPRSYAGWAPTAPPPHPAVAPGPLTPFLLYSSKPILPPPLFVSPSIFFHAGNRRRKPPLLQSVGQRHVELPLAASRSAILYKKPRSCRPLFTIRPPRPLLVARPLWSASSPTNASPSSTGVSHASLATQALSSTSPPVGHHEFPPANARHRVQPSMVSFLLLSALRWIHPVTELL
jgi:hypothetical protein